MTGDLILPEKDNIYLDWQELIESKIIDENSELVRQQINILFPTDSYLPEQMHWE